SPDGKTLASTSCDENLEFTIRLWELATKQSTKEWTTPALGSWCSIAFSPDGKKLASGGLGEQIRLWDLSDGTSTLLHEDRGGEYARPYVMFSPDGSTLASGGRCIRETRLFDAASGQKIVAFDTDDMAGVMAVRFAADGRTLVSSSGRGQLDRWGTSAD